MGRGPERENGTLPVIKGYEEIEYEITIGFLEGQEIEDFERTLSIL
jgi:hypothetical protein